MSHTVLARLQQHLHNKKRKPYREHRCGAGQIPSKGQVRTSSQLQSARVGVNYAYLFLRVFGVFIVVQNRLPLFAQQGVFLWERSSLMSVYYIILFILGLFPYWDSINQDQSWDTSYFPLRFLGSHLNHVEAMWSLRPVLLTPVHLGSVRHQDSSSTGSLISK